jgi:PAT family beta-lactamase induction signal transducer AmpG
MAGVMAAAMIVTLLAPEPEPAAGAPQSFRQALIGPFVEFFTRHGELGKAFLLLAFIVLFKLGDNVASHMTIPFYLETGFTNTEIGAVVKAFGVVPLLVGVFAGGVLTLRIGLFAALVISGVLQGISTACFVVLATVGYDLGWLAAVIAFENFTAGMGTAALLAFLAYLTNRQFTATQFALLTALASLPRVVLVAPSGWLASQLGWIEFFLLGALIAVPGLMLLVYLRSWFERGVGAEHGAAGRSAAAESS